MDRSWSVVTGGGKGKGKQEREKERQESEKREIECLGNRLMTAGGKLR